LKTKFDILKKKQKEGRERKNVKGKKNKKEGRERKTEIYYFYQFIMTPYYYDSPFKKKSLYTPCIAFTHLQQFLLVFIFTLHVSPYHLPIYYTSSIFLYCI
jgi:hypothetical protein